MIIKNNNKELFWQLSCLAKHSFCSSTVFVQHHKWTFKGTTKFCEIFNFMIKIYAQKIHCFFFWEIQVQQRRCNFIAWIIKQAKWWLSVKAVKNTAKAAKIKSNGIRIMRPNFLHYFSLTVIVFIVLIQMWVGIVSWVSWC